MNLSIPVESFPKFGEKTCRSENVQIFNKNVNRPGFVPEGQTDLPAIKLASRLSSDLRNELVTVSRCAILHFVPAMSTFFSARLKKGAEK